MVIKFVKQGAGSPHTWSHESPAQNERTSVLLFAAFHPEVPCRMLCPVLPCAAALPRAASGASPPRAALIPALGTHPA